MDRTQDFEQFTSGRTNARTKRYIPSDETTSLLTKIYKMKSHLTKYGHDYLNTYGYLPGACVLTDERRHKLDTDVEEFIDACHEKLKILESEIRLSTKSQQVINHKETVIRIVKRVLNDLFNCFNHLKTTKIVRQMEKQKYDRIELNGSDEAYDTLENDPLNLEQFTLDESNNQNLSTTNISNLSSATNQQDSRAISFDDCRQQSLLAAEHDASIGPNQIQELALENTQIHDELITFDDEVKLIGKKVVQISKLQELFTEKVMEQAADLDSLHETAIKSSENVREGNDLIRDAMMRNASTRVFILFYIVTLGFSILFLDWYNP